MNSTPTIIQLDDNIANQIAAGEVVERPAAAVKELVENAIDADADRIEIRFRDGGKTLIEVRDNGHGIATNQLGLAVTRHATSKLASGDLMAVSSFGFRGEALPSIGAVSRMEIHSRPENADAMGIEINAGEITEPKPVSMNAGTVVRVRDLFYATPARLKFMGTDRAEGMAITDIVKRLAMSRPEIGFVLIDDAPGKSRKIIDVQPSDPETRWKALLGAALLNDALALNAHLQDLELSGYVGLPTAARGSAGAQYFFVNDRPVRDKLFFGAVKGAYRDLLPSGKFPFVILKLDLPSADIDVNVHPAKTEIRFHDAAKTRSFVLNAIRYRLAEAGQRVDHNLSEQIIGSFSNGAQMPSHSNQYQGDYHKRPSTSALQSAQMAQMPGLADAPRAFAPAPDMDQAETEIQTELPLGLARAHLFDNYIIAEAEDGLVIIDGHAAHERLVYEQLKQDYAEKRMQSQRLLVPEIIDLPIPDRDQLLSVSGELAELGLEIEAFGEAIAVHAMPASLAQGSPAKLVAGLLDEIRNETSGDPSAALSARMDAILSSMACHGSVRSGRKLRPEEMNALLRQMEATPNSGVCNHGRPTFIKLDKKSLEARFGR